MTQSGTDMVAGFLVNIAVPFVIIKRARPGAIGRGVKLAVLYWSVLVLVTLQTGMLPATPMDPQPPWWGIVLVRLLTRAIFALALGYVVAGLISGRPMAAVSVSLLLPLISETAGRASELWGLYEFWQYCQAEQACLDADLAMLLGQSVSTTFVPPIAAGIAMAVCCAIRRGPRV